MSADPTPNSVESQKIRRWTIALNISTFLIVLLPLIGLAGTIIGIVGTFKALNASPTPDLSVLAANNSAALYTFAVALVISILAAYSFITSNIGLRRTQVKSQTITNQRS